MEENKYSSFTSVTREKRPIYESKWETPRIKAKESRISSRLAGLKNKVEEMPESYKKLLVRTAVCAILVLGIWGIRNLDYDVTNRISDGIVKATADEPAATDDDEDLGKLKFVSGEEVLATEGYSLPVTGEVVESFSDTEKDVKIKSEQAAKVNAILSGVVVKTTEDSVVIENENGTVTTYTGLVPGVVAGDKVKNSDSIGTLEGEILCLETVSGIGYIDSLDASELNSALDHIES